jgi:hypothetical protein
MIKRLILYDLFNIIPAIIPLPRVDIGVSGWYTGWYGKGHLLISILKISISSNIQFNQFLYLIIINGNISYEGILKQNILEDLLWRFLFTVNRNEDIVCESFSFKIILRSTWSEIRVLITVHETYLLLITCSREVKPNVNCLKVIVILVTSLLIVSTRISGGDQ